MNTKQIMKEIDRLCKEYDEKEKAKEEKMKAKKEKDRRRHHHHHRHHHSKTAEEPVNTTVAEKESVVAASEEVVAARNVTPTTITVNLKPEMVADKMVAKIINNDAAIKDSVEADIPQNTSSITVNVDTQSVIDGVATKLLEKSDAASEEEVVRKMNSISMNDFINMMVSSIIEVIDGNNEVFNEVQTIDDVNQAVEINADNDAEDDNSTETNTEASTAVVVEDIQVEADSNTAEAVA